MSAFVLHLYANYDSITEGAIEESKVEIQGAGYRSVELHKIVYRYQVKGVVFYSDRINLSSMLSKPYYMVEKYPTDKVVKVFYDSNKPRYAVLENDGLGYSVYFRIFIIFCILFGGIGLNAHTHYKLQKKLSKYFPKG